VKNPWKMISHVILLSHLQTHISGTMKKYVDNFSERVAIGPWILSALKRWNLWKRWIPQMLKKTKNIMSRTWWWDKLKQANHHKLTTSVQHPDSFAFLLCSVPSQTQNLSRRQSHKFDGIGVRGIRTCPFSSEAAYDSISYDDWKPDCHSRKKKDKDKPIPTLARSYVLWLA